VPQQTWRHGSSFASWTWSLPIPQDLSNEWVVRFLDQLIETLHGFARPPRALLELAPAPDLRFELPAQYRDLVSAIRQNPGIRLVYLDLDLECVTLDGPPFDLPHGATLMLSLRRGEDGLNAADEPPLLTLYLHADIYDPDSSGGDNESMAAANVPRLTAFLHRIEALGVTFEDLDNPYCPGATQYGFAEPERDH